MCSTSLKRYDSLSSISNQSETIPSVEYPIRNDFYSTISNKKNDSFSSISNQKLFLKYNIQSETIPPVQYPIRNGSFSAISYQKRFFQFHIQFRNYFFSSISNQKRFLQLNIQSETVPLVQYPIRNGSFS